MLISDSAVTRFVVIILELTVPLVVIRIVPGSKHLKFRKKEQIVRGRCNIACHTSCGVADIVGVLRHRLHNSPEIGGQRGHQAIGQRAGRRFAIAQQGFSHAGVLPSADIGVTVIHVEVASPTHATVILVIAKAHHRPADLAELPVDPVRPLLGGIVVEAQDKGADGKVGEGEIAHLPVDGDALGITHAPVVRTLIRIAGRPDRRPGIGVQRSIEQVHLHGTGLVCGGRVICALCHLDCNGGAAIGFACHGNRIAGNRHRGNAGGIGGGRDCPIARPGNRDGGGRSALVQSDIALIQGQAACRLSDFPYNCLGSDAAVTPLIIAGGRKGGVIIASISTAGCAADGQLCAVIVAPAGALRQSTISQAAALHRSCGNGCPLDLPLHAPGCNAAVAPLIVAGWGKGCRVAARIGGRCLSTNGQLGGVVVIPSGGLRLPSVGQAPALRGGLGNGGSAYRPSDFLCGVGAIAPSVSLFRSKGGDIVACVGAFGCAANGQGFRVIAVPVRALFAARIGQTAVLSRNRINGMGQLRDGFQSGIRSSQSIGSVCPCLVCHLCRVVRCFQCFRGLFIRSFRCFRCSSGGPFWSACFFTAWVLLIICCTTGLTIVLARTGSVSWILRIAAALYSGLSGTV